MSEVEYSYKPVIPKNLCDLRISALSLKKKYEKNNKIQAFLVRFFHFYQIL